MSSCIDSYVTNWFAVTDAEELNQLVESFQERTQFDHADSGEAIRLHERDGRHRITLYDNLDASLTAYDEYWGEECDLADQVAALLAEGEVLRVTYVSWFKGSISYGESVYTWDGRSESQYSHGIREGLATALDIPADKLG